MNQMFADLFADDEGGYEPVKLVSPKEGFTPERKLDGAQELDARFETAEFLEAIGARPEDEITQEMAKEAAQKAFHDFAANVPDPVKKTTLANAKTPESVKRIVGMLANYDWQFVDEAHREPKRGIRAGVEVLHEELLALQVIDDVAAQDVKVRRLDRLVDLAPPHLRFARRFLDHELVVRRTAGMGAGAAHQRTFHGQGALLPTEGVLIQQSGGQVEVNRLRSLHAVRFESLPCLRRTHKKMAPNSMTGSPTASKPSMVQMAVGLSQYA